MVRRSLDCARTAAEQGTGAAHRIYLGRAESAFPSCPAVSRTRRNGVSRSRQQAAHCAQVGACRRPDHLSTCAGAWFGLRQRFTRRAGMKAQISNAASVRVPATRYKPEDSVPVMLLSAPMTVGLMKPARLAVELIKAIPAAAPAPPRNDVGSAQNMGSALTTPMATMVRPTTDNTALCAVLAQTTKPDAAKSAGTMTCQRRSRCLSALRPIRIMLSSAAV